MTNLTRLAALCLLLLQGGCGWFEPELPALEPGYQYLFDGKTLNGWQKIGGGATFTVRDQSVVGHWGEGDNTFLRTEANYGDFILKLEVKFDEPGNSGIMFRAHQRGAEHANPGRTYGYQFELDPSERSWSGGIYDEARRGWLFDLQNLPEARAALKTDDWNQVTIEAVGGLIKTSLNEVPIAELADAFDLSGFIALQVHSGNSGIIRWRNIRIKSLDGNYQWDEQLLASATEWRSNSDSLQFSGTTMSVAPKTATWIESRRQLKDYALELTVPACQQTKLLVRSKGNRGLELGLANDSVVLTQRDTNEVLGELVFGQADNYRLHIAATSDNVSVSVNDKLLGVSHQASLPDRGNLRIEAQACAGEPITFSSMRWLDLKQQPKEKLLYQTLDTPPAPPLTPEQALQSFSIAPGFRIELVAAEPLVEAPVAMSWGSDGKLYVVEMRGFMPDAYGEGQFEPVGRVVVLQDENGDGLMDTSKVFLDGLVSPRGVAVVNEGVLVAEPPNLWLCQNTGGDSCTDKIRVGEYGIHGDDPNIEHMENGLMTGLDNWLYNAKQGRRLRLNGTELSVQPSLQRGQWGISQDNQGRLFYNNNSVFIMGDYYPAEYVLEQTELGPVAGVRTQVSVVSGDREEVFSVRVNPGVNRAYLDGTLKPDGRLAAPTAVSGLAVYRGHQFPPQYHNDVFVPEPGANVVAQFRLREADIALQADHITYADERWGQREFVASTDERFRPVDAKVGPDGALYIIDMYRGILQEQAFLTDELRDQILQRGLDKPLNLGRIWRVVHDQSEVDYTPPDLTAASTEQLIALLSHPNGWQRDTAQRLLRDRAPSAALRALAASGNGLAASHALWALENQQQLDSATVLQALAAGDSWVQVQALRAGGQLLAADEMLAAVDLLDLQQPQLALQSLFSLSDFNGNLKVQQTLLDIISANTESPVFAAASVQAVAGQEQVFLAALLQHPAWQTASDGKVNLLAKLAGHSYRAIRPDITDTDPAPLELQQLLQLTATQTGDLEWRQLALLEGFKAISLSNSFVPAQLAQAPPIFVDADIQADSPLWQARLGARRAFTWPGDELAAGLTPLTPAQLAAQEKGQKLYQHCAACHGENGAGTPGLAPSLIGTEWVLGPPEWLARIVMQGLSGPLQIDGQTWNGVMPGHQQIPGFDDETTAGLLTYLRRSWGNTAEPVDAALVAEVRQHTKNRSTPWTVSELHQVPFKNALDKYVGVYKVSFISFTVSAENNGLHLSVPMYGAGEMEQLSETEFFAAAGGERVKVRFELAEDGTVPAMLILRNGETIRAPREE